MPCTMPNDSVRINGMGILRQTDHLFKNTQEDREEEQKKKEKKRFYVKEVQPNTTQTRKKENNNANYHPFHTVSTLFFFNDVLIRGRLFCLIPN